MLNLTSLNFHCGCTYVVLQHLTSCFLWCGCVFYLLLIIFNFSNPLTPTTFLTPLTFIAAKLIV